MFWLRHRRRILAGAFCLGAVVVVGLWIAFLASPLYVNVPANADSVSVPKLDTQWKGFVTTSTEKIPKSERVHIEPVDGRRSYFPDRHGGPLSQYTSALNKVVSGVVIVDRIQYALVDKNGTQYEASVEAGGTYSGSLVIIAQNRHRPGENPYYQDVLVHHEISSVILHALGDLFPETGWKSWSGEYRREGAGEFLASGVDPWSTSENLLSDGFINRYASVSLEQDFNTVAAFMMSKEGRNELARVVAEYPPIRKKVITVMAMYAQLGIVSDATRVWWEKALAVSFAARASSESRCMDH